MSNTTNKVVVNGLFIALVFLCTYFTRIPGPVPPGYINFGDSVIIVGAILFGRGCGLISGSIGSAIADLASPGGIIFAPITFIVKGLEGYVAGAVAERSNAHKRKEVLRIAGAVAAALIMVLGYFIAECYILGIFDKTFGYAAAIAELPFNLIQGGVSVVLGYLLSSVLLKLGVADKILNNKLF
ncbi:putative membrane protein [Anaerobacterium chartisolvens]|uniref:Putative membrane protein n=1 Tax=Anaerobacterium chartisolvens TaxID=1297424 RepID=A0A369BAD6_9FIRM|nr:ECF transporter S component [Anaerobacterium chartisolvens]RCX17558.1 putative membrane protein [Anaerobacterium chartisolvens]